MQENCDCPSPSPLPSCTPNEGLGVQSPFFGYYMGEAINPSGTLTNVRFGSLDHLYFATEEDWTIEDYSVQDLIDADILPPASETNGFDKFVLNEREIIFVASEETWSAYLSDWLASHYDEDTSSYDFTDAPFGILAGRALGYDTEQFDLMRQGLASIVSAADSGDISGLGTSQNKQILPILDDLEPLYTIKDKIILCWEWINNIATNYYGKKFLVKIGEDTPMDSLEVPPADGHQPFKGICIKDSFGAYPRYESEGGLGTIFFINGDGEGQGYSVSDQVSPDGAFPYDSQLETVLGLSGLELDWVKTEDGRISSFIKAGLITNSSGEINTYSKFSTSWFLDFTKLNTGNYFLKQTDGGIVLYLKCSIEDKIYCVTGQAPISYTEKAGQWAIISLSEPIPLSLFTEDFSAFRKIYEALKVLVSDQVTAATANIIKYFNIPPTVEDWIDQIADFFGARHNLSQQNILNINNISYLPAGCVVPMKSNIYTYGPYFYDGLPDPLPSNAPDNSGGIDVVKHEVLVPWNFYDPKSGQDPITNAYSKMNCVGAALAKDSSKGLQKVERGKITVAGFPTLRKLGESIDDSSKFPDGDGPTLLTDISVDYGSTGFRTTYNFQSHTQRFGQTSKHILNAWTEAIKQNQVANEYFRQERLRVNELASRQTTKIAETKAEKFGRITPIYTKKFTPHKLLISGYYFDPGSASSYDDSPDTTQTVYSSPYPSDAPFDPCDQPGPLPSPSFSPAPNTDRIYSFAETHEAYQSVHVQSTYRQLHIMGMDGLYLPVSLRGDIIPSPSPNNTGRIARFSMRHENNGDYVEWEDSDNINYNKYSAGYPNPSKTRDEIPPFKLIGSDSPKVYSLPINQQYLNPLLSSKLLEDWDERKNGSDKGFVISSIAFGSDYNKFQLTHNDLGLDEEDNPILGDDEILRQEQENFRFSALRGPLVVQGWGYDTTGKPIPNSADTAYKTERGKFTKFNLTDKFMANWIENPRTWPVGPVDLRFDRERGVWTCPSPNKIIVARLKDKLKPYGKARAQLLNPEAGGIRFYQNYDISGPNGENIKLHLKNTIIMVYDFLGVELYANDVIYGYYDDNRYIVLESSRNYKDSDQDLEYKDFEEYPTTCTTTTVTTTTVTTTTPPCDWCGLECLQTLPTYKDNVKQILGHDEKGCLIWIDTTTCEEEICLCCNLDNTDITFTGQSGVGGSYIWNVYVLEDCPYIGEDSPGGASSAVGFSAFNTGFEEWTFYIQIYCNDTPDFITAVYNGSNFTIAGGIVSGSATGIAITSASTACVQNGTVDISIDVGGNATVTINP